MRRRFLPSVLLSAIAALCQACTFASPSPLTLEDFTPLEKGMTYAQVVGVLGEPRHRVAGSSAFATYEFKLATGESIYLGFYPQADYLDSAYYFLLNDEGKKTGIKWIVPGPVDFPRGITRELTLNDFQGIMAGMVYFPDIYNQVGPPNATAYFGGNRFALVYDLSDGSRISMVAPYGLGCISKISYSPSSSAGATITTLSEDIEGVCEGK